MHGSKIEKKQNQGIDAFEYYNTLIFIIFGKKRDIIIGGGKEGENTCIQVRMRERGERKTERVYDSFFSIIHGFETIHN